MGPSASPACCPIGGSCRTSIQSPTCHVGVRLTAYVGDSDDLPAASLQRHLDRPAAGQVPIGPVRVYTFDQIREAHADMEHDRLFGKGVVVFSP
jgi:hypothetical protein